MEQAASGSLFAEERKKHIVEAVRSKRKVLVSELVERFDVSPATVRNDLRELERQGVLRRTHGGAIDAELEPPKAGYEPDNAAKVAVRLAQKRAIARRALAFVEPGDIIALDSGTTMLELALLLEDARDLTVVTCDLAIARCLEPFEGVNVIVVGGSLRRGHSCTTGPLAVQLLQELGVDKLFLATNHLSPEKGCTTPSIAQAEVKKAMIAIASRVYLLCDSAKFGSNSMVQFCPVSELDALITDDEADEDALARFRKAGCETVVASV